MAPYNHLWSARHVLWRTAVCDTLLQDCKTQPQGDSNPCLQAENLTSWAGLDDGAPNSHNPASITCRTGVLFFVPQSYCSVKHLDEMVMVKFDGFCRAATPAVLAPTDDRRRWLRLSRWRRGRAGARGRSDRADGGPGAASAVRLDHYRRNHLTPIIICGGGGGRAWSPRACGTHRGSSLG